MVIVSYLYQCTAPVQEFSWPSVYVNNLRRHTRRISPCPTIGTICTQHAQKQLSANPAGACCQGQRHLNAALVPYAHICMTSAASRRQKRTLNYSKVWKTKNQIPLPAKVATQETKCAGRRCKLHGDQTQAHIHHVQARQIPRLSPQDLLDAEGQARQLSACFHLLPHCSAKVEA